MWNKVFKSRFLKGLENQLIYYFYVLVAILILFFLDAIRAVPASRDESKSYYQFMQEYYSNDTENPTTNVEEKIKERNILLRDNQIG